MLSLSSKCSGQSAPVKLLWSKQNLGGPRNSLPSREREKGEETAMALGREGRKKRRGKIREEER